MCFQPVRVILLAVVSGWKIQPEGMSFRRYLGDTWYSHLCQKGIGGICTLQRKVSFLPSLGATGKSPTTLFWHVGQGEGGIKDDSSWKSRLKF